MSSDSPCMCDTCLTFGGRPKSAPQTPAPEVEPECTVYSSFCRKHDFHHGAEAEELRAGIETIIELMHDLTDADDILSCKDCGDYKAKAILRSLQRLLDRVDARDSLAYLEKRDEEEHDEA